MDRQSACRYIAQDNPGRCPDAARRMTPAVTLPGKVLRLYERYAARHLHVAVPGFALHDDAGHEVGRVESIGFAGSRFRVAGWTTAGRVVLHSGAAEVAARPAIPRPDLPQPDSGPIPAGFALDITLSDRGARLLLQGPAGETVHDLPAIPPGRIRLARLALWPPFLWAGLRATPPALRWWRTRDPRLKARVKTLLGLDLLDTALAMADDLFGTDPVPEAPLATPITIILPVYNAFDLLPEVLDRVARHTGLPWHLLLIEDASTDPAVRPFLRGWAAARPDHVTLIENAANLGFIGSVNRGFALALERGHHVVLLNSDALVPQGWAERLVRSLLERPGVASVTPMSNDAEIFSVPVVCRAVALEPGQGDAIDAVARRFAPGLARPVVPTGVGFCMALSIGYLRQVPAFDAAFGRGYGEEVDWCRKVAALGGQHLALPGLFVEHRGGSSFGSAAKQRLVQANNAIIAARYPGYDQAVQDFIRDDPLTAPRLALALAWAGSREAGSQGQGVPVYLAHSLGGGAESYLQQRIAATSAAGGASVVLRVGGPQRWQVELYSPAGRVAGTTGSFALVQQLLEPLTRRHIVYSCGVGDPAPLDLPGHLLALKRGPADRIEVLFHDFFPVTPSYCLLGQDGRYHGPVTAANPDPAHQARQDGAIVPLAGWQAAWGTLVAAADAVVVFSADSRQQVLAAYPDARVEVRPHRMLGAVPQIAAPGVSGAGPQGRAVIGVLGNIGPQKGAAVVAGLGRALARDPQRRLVLIGTIDPAFALHGSVRVHGPYQIQDLPELVARYGVTCWLIPSIWPETFSFVTHEALATGLPVYCFALGAQGEAVAAAPNGRLIPLAGDRDPVQAVLEAVG
jgi:GT2 family glycosyltransferase/glycosyltransferase involved in cell wall biosynthesis